jgi:hypothetical protein
MAYRQPSMFAGDYVSCPYEITATAAGLKARRYKRTDPSLLEQGF